METICLQGTGIHHEHGKVEAKCCEETGSRSSTTPGGFEMFPPTTPPPCVGPNIDKYFFYCFLLTEAFLFMLCKAPFVRQ